VLSVPGRAEPSGADYAHHSFGREDRPERALGSGAGAGARARVGGEGRGCAGRFDLDIDAGDTCASEAGAAEAGGGRAGGVERGVAVAARGRGQDAAAADGAGGVGEQPGIDAGEVEAVVAVGEEPDLLAGGEFAQADDALGAARGVQERLERVGAVGDHGERLDDALVQTLVRVVVVLRLERAPPAHDAARHGVDERGHDEREQEHRHDDHHVGVEGAGEVGVVLPHGRRRERRIRRVVRVRHLQELPRVRIADSQTGRHSETLVPKFSLNSPPHSDLNSITSLFGCAAATKSHDS
jgi:hypothetical protein